jgi:hypothetical protein
MDEIHTKANLVKFNALSNFVEDLSKNIDAHSLKLSVLEKFRTDTIIQLKNKATIP